jgi:DNA-binding NtrC family response regulator
MLPVFVVGDSADVCSALEELLAHNGLRTVRAAGIDSAREALDREPVGVIVQELSFGAGTTRGSEAIGLFDAMRAKRPDLPIILVANLSSLVTAARLVEEGAEYYVETPWNGERLVARVRELARRTERRGPPHPVVGRVDGSTPRVSSATSGAYSGAEVGKISRC